MEKIAILVSTSPLRKTTTREGVTKQRLNEDACLELADQFDRIIVGSLAADEVFQYVERHLARDVVAKFRFYPRTFFHSFNSGNPLQSTDDPRDAGWEQILTENGIRFQMEYVHTGADHRRQQTKFSWEHLTDFITDPRVALVSGGEGQLFCETPAAVDR